MDIFTKPLHVRNLFCVILSARLPSYLSVGADAVKRLLCGTGVFLTAIACGEMYSASADELPSPETLALAAARNSPDELRPLFTSLVGTGVLGDEYRDVLRTAFANADPQIRLCAALGLSATGQHDEAVVQEILMALVPRIVVDGP